jgi:glycosyltransferase involved in cell wall biosynthesis
MYINWPLKRLLSRIIMRNANRVVAQTNDMKDGLLKIQDRDIEVIPNGIDLSKFQPMSKSEARTRLRLQPNMKMILFVGRARPEKNLFGFIDVMSCLRSRGDCYGIALGDGQQLEQAKRMADSRGLYNIMFKGNVDNSEVPIYMHAADTLVNTSHSEGFPVVFLEAMACGLPIVAPKICGIPEIIDNEKNGFLVDLGNPVEIALVVSRILNDDELVREIRRNNFKKAREFSWENVVKKLY